MECLVAQSGRGRGPQRQARGRVRGAFSKLPVGPPPPRRLRRSSRPDSPHCPSAYLDSAAARTPSGKTTRCSRCPTRFAQYSRGEARLAGARRWHRPWSKAARVSGNRRWWLRAGASGRFGELSEMRQRKARVDLWQRRRRATGVLV